MNIYELTDPLSTIRVDKLKISNYPLPIYTYLIMYLVYYLLSQCTNNQYFCILYFIHVGISRGINIYLKVYNRKNL